MTKILLVEDDKSLREIYGVRLLAEGYDIVSAGDGEEALAMAIKERPDLIVSDVMMPKISGFDMLDILRSTTETKNIKVIMMTALSSEDQRARGEALGADRYLVKSQVGIEDVVRTVHEVLGDAPTAQPAAAQTFAPPPPSAVPRTAARPTPPAYPSASTDDHTAAVAPAPAMPPAQPAHQPQPTATPVAAPQPQPIAAPTMPPQAGQPAPATTLPLPTAPFSTPRPANLGDRIINPLPQATSDKPDIASMMSHELDMAEAAPNSLAPQPAPQSQPQPVAAPEPIQPVQTAPIAAPVAPQPAVATEATFTPPPMSSTPQPAQPGVLHGASQITFEETPLPTATTSQPVQATPTSDAPAAGSAF